MDDSHIVKLPLGIWIVKIIQTVIAVIVLALCAYGVHYYPAGAYCFALFTALFSVLILTYYFVSLHAWQAGYNWIAVLVLEVAAVIFWLCTFGVLAWLYVFLSAAWSGYYSYGYYYRKRSLEDTFLGVLATALAFSALQFVLYVTTLVFLSIRVHRHRKAGMPSNAGGPVTSHGHVEEQKGSNSEQPISMGPTNVATLEPKPHAEQQPYNQYPSGPEQIPSYTQSPLPPTPYGQSVQQVSPIASQGQTQAPHQTPVNHHEVP